MYDFLVGRDEEIVPYRARQLRNLLCDLGPSFIKAGQVISFSLDDKGYISLYNRNHWSYLSYTIVLTFFGSVLQVLANRPDIIREDYMNELCILQDDVPPVPNQVYGYSRYLFFKIILEYVQMKLE
jgi:aarF domain-containing kinase